MSQENKQKPNVRQIIINRNKNKKTQYKKKTRTRNVKKKYKIISTLGS